MRRLVPCPACQRHVFVDASATEPPQSGCPHCGTKEIHALAVLALAASMGVAACTAPAVAVYGPAPEPTDARSTLPVPSASDAPMVAVYGPPPSLPDQRNPDAGAGPDAGAIQSAQPTATPTPTMPQVHPAPIYGPAPRDPNQRTLNPNDPSSPPRR